MSFIQSSYRQIAILLVVLSGLGPLGTLRAQVNALYTIEGQEPYATIPFEQVSDLLIVTVTINGVLPLKFIFDTGAEHTLLTEPALSRLLKLEYERAFTVYGADLTTPLTAYLAKGIALQVGDLWAQQQNVLVLAEDYLRLETWLGMPIQGILGTNFFRHFVVKIDYRKNLIHLIPHDKFEPPSGKKFSTLPLIIRHNKPYLTATVQLHDTTIISGLRLLIDTGASLALLLQTGTHPQLYPPPTALTGTLGTGVGGAVQGYLTRIEQLRIDTFKFKNISTQYQEMANPRLDTAALVRHGIVGNQLLERFTVYIDFLREQLYLRPNKTYKKAFAQDRMGLQLIATGKQLRTYLIQDVLATSPAAAAGLQRGDELLRINGIPATWLSMSQLYTRFQRKAGTTLRVRYRRGADTGTIAVTLKDIF